MATLRRRAAAIGAVAAVLGSPVLGSPLTGTAFGADAFAAKSITTDPAPDSNNVVPANRPTVVATFNQKLSAKSTITLVEKGKSGNLCSSFQLSDDKTSVSCTPASDLALETTYVAVGHGVSTSGDKATTDKLEFTVSYPKFQGDQSAPVAGGSEIKGSESITAQFDQGVSGDSSSFAVFEVKPDGSRGAPLAGTVSFGKDTLSGDSDGTVSFKPAFTLQGASATSLGKYEAVVLVHGVDSSGKANPAAVGLADYFFYVNNTKPADLATPQTPANNTNDTEFPFTGTAPVGLDVVVTVEDPSDPTGQFPASGDVVVPPCDAAPICPWTLNLDISGIGDGTAVKWSADATDVDDSKTDTGSTDGNPFTKDTNAPSQPDVTADDPADGDSTVTTAVRVAASYSGTPPTDVVSYHVTITDAEGNTVEQDYAASGGNLPATAVDVQTLDDGKLTVQAQAQDAAGNRSDYSNPLDGPPTVTKKTGLAPNLGTSTFTSQGVDTTFVDAGVGAVHSPETVTLRFTQPIKLSYTDYTSTSGPKSHGSSLCITTAQGNCVATATPSVSDDGRGLVIKLSSPLPDDTYGVKATTYSKNNCPDKTPANASSWSCDGFSGIVPDLAGQPYTFTVDSTPPTVEVTTVSPDPIHSDGVDSVTISGTTSADTTGVQLVIRSSGGKGSRLAPATITPQSGGDSTWSAGPLDLSALLDGRLTITAKARDGAGNTGVGHGHAKLAAHQSKLTEHASDSRITYGHAITLSGRLTDENGNGIASATITVQPKFGKGRLGMPETATTDSRGRWSMLAGQAHNATFWASYDGSTSSPVHDPASTHSARVLVHALIKVQQPDGGASVSSPVVVKGKVKPNKKHEKVQLYRKTGHGKVLLDTDRLNKRSRFVLRSPLPSGKVRLLVKIGKTAGNLGGKRTIVVHVH